MTNANGEQHRATSVGRKAVCMKFDGRDINELYGTGQDIKSPIITAAATRAPYINGGRPAWLNILHFTIYSCLCNYKYVKCLKLLPDTD